MKVQAIGMAWYREADYDKLRAVFVDGDRLPRTFLQWQDQAEQGRKRYVGRGWLSSKRISTPTHSPHGVLPTVATSTPAAA